MARLDIFPILVCYPKSNRGFHGFPVQFGKIFLEQEYSTWREILIVLSKTRGSKLIARNSR